MPQPFFLELSGVRIHRSNLLKPGVEIYSYNDHVRLLSPEPVGWIQHHQPYSSGGADIVMESITLKTPANGQKCTSLRPLDCSAPPQSFDTPLKRAVTH